jgi:hypothetical protein
VRPKPARASPSRDQGADRKKRTPPASERAARKIMPIPDTVAGCTLAVLFAASIAAAQDPAPKATPAPAPAKATDKQSGAGTFTVEAGEIALPALIDRAAACLGCNILWNAGELTGQTPPLRLQHAVTTDRDGCLEFLASSLYRANFALTRADARNGTLEAIFLGGPRGREVTARAETRTVEQVLAQPSLCMPVTATVPLQHINATIATNALRPFFASTGAPSAGATLTLGNVGAMNAMLLSGMQDKVAQAIGMLREVDKPPPMPAENVPMDAAKRIEELERRVKVLEDKLADAAKTKR